MSKLLLVLMASAVASVVAAQTAAPSTTTKDRPRNAQSVTQVTGDNSGNAQATAAEQAKNVTTSKQVTKMSRDDKTQLAKDATKLNVNPENSSGTAATAVMQPRTTAVSRATTKQNTEFKSKEGKQQLQKDLQSKSTP